MATGTPEEVAAIEASHTGRFLRGVSRSSAPTAPAASNGRRPRRKVAAAA